MTQGTPDYIYSGQYLLPSSRQSEVIDQGALAVAGSTIVDIDSEHNLRSRYPNVAVNREPHGLIMPGLINSHTHAAMSCFRGLADDLPLMTWLEKHIFPIEAQLTPEIVYNSTLLSIAEMIRSGTTSFCDMYLFSSDVARAAVTAGIRAWIGEVLYDFPSPCYGEVTNGITYLKDLFSKYASHPLVTITTDPHSVYTCSPDLLQELYDIATENKSLYVIHLSENDVEVQTCLERYDRRPVEHLNALGVLGESTLASHCVKLDDTDMDILQERNVRVAHCIESNMKLASGIAPVPELIERKIVVSLGTDGSASNNDVDMFAEMNSVAKMHKVVTMNPTVMGAEETLNAATIGGARALNAEKMIGSLEIGKEADFIVLDLNQPHMVPLYNIPSHLVYVARGADVLHTFVAGRQLMKNRKIVSFNEKDLLKKMRSLSKHIIELRN